MTPDVRPAPIDVLLVDDHAIVNAGVRMLLESHGSLRVIGEARNRDEALRLRERARPRIVLLDLDLGTERGLDFLPELLEPPDVPRVLVLTASANPALHREALRLGVAGIVLKENAPAVLLQAIERVSAGEVWLDPLTAANLVRETSPPESPEARRIARLTRREREIIEQIGLGLRNAEVGRRLFISETTVRHHLTSIFQKLEVGDRFALVLFAYRHGLARRPD